MAHARLFSRRPRFEKKVTTSAFSLSFHGSTPMPDNDSQILPLLPEPWRFQRLPGTCVLEGHVTVLSISGEASDAAAELLASEFRARGLSASSSSSSSSSPPPPPPTSSEPETATNATFAAAPPPPPPVAVSVTVAPGATPSLLSNPLGASEGYEIEATPTALAVRASGPAGAFYAVQTLGQLLPPPPPPPRTKRNPEPLLPSPLVRLPCLEVADAPRFAWRGLLLDVARHFFSARFVVDLIKVIASYKMNVLHLHLVDDQGWRLPPEVGGEGGVERGGEGGTGEAGEEDAPPPAPAARVPSPSSPSSPPSF